MPAEHPAVFVHKISRPHRLPGFRLQKSDIVVAGYKADFHAVSLIRNRQTGFLCQPAHLFLFAILQGEKRMRQLLLR